MAKSLDNILGGYTPKAKGEQEFVAKHEIEVTPDANKNGDDVFKASKVKTVKRSPERHGYDKPQDEKVHEEIMTSADKKKEKKLKAKYDDSEMKSSMQKQYGAEKGKQVYFATIRKQAMESVGIEEGNYDDMIAAFKAKGGQIKKVDYKQPDEKQKAKLSATWTRGGGGGRGGSAAAASEYSSMNKTDAEYNAKQANARKKSMGMKESAEVTEGLKYAQVEPKDVKSVLAAHRATGESARHMGNGKIAYSGKKLVTSQNEAVEVEEEKKGLYYYINRRKKLGISRPAGYPKAPTAQDFKNAAKTAKESVELDEGVAQDAYNNHHKRAMKAVEDLAKHLMKHKANCDKSDSKWSHSDNLWQMKNMSSQLEDMVHNIATQNEQSSERNKLMNDRGY